MMLSGKLVKIVLLMVKVMRVKIDYWITQIPREVDIAVMLEDLLLYQNLYSARDL